MFAKYLIIILLPLLIILANLNFLAFNRDFYTSIHSKIQSDIDLEQRIDYSNNIIGYYQNKNNLDQNFYSNQAQLHLREVKHLLRASTIIIGLSTIIILSLITILAHEKKYESIFTAGLYSSLFLIGTLLLLSLGISKSFEQLFIGMHEVIFMDDLWLFPSTDTLIQVFPNDFFVLFANQLVINTLVCATFLAIVSVIAKRNLVKAHGHSSKN